MKMFCGWFGEERNLWRNVTKRRTGFAGHIQMQPGLVNLLIQGSVGDKNCRGRQRLK